MAAPTKADRLIRYLGDIMKSQNPKDQEALVKAISMIFGNTNTREIYDSMAKTFNPLKDVNLYSYMPMRSTKKVHGEEVELSPQDMIRNTNTQINLKNIIGDVLSAAGQAANIKNQALSRVFQNEANKRSQHERDLYGANYVDTTADIGSPTASVLGGIEQMLTNVVANRLYGNAALQRQAEMQAIMDAYNRNVGGTGLFFDARRKSSEGLFAPSTMGK